MRTFPQKSRPVLAYALGFGFLALAGQASATCLSGFDEGTSPGKAPKPLAPTASSTPLVQAVYRPNQSSAPTFQRVSDWNDNGGEPIVGLWQFTMTNGDFGTQAWHADGTELMLSAGRDPAKGDVCQGVWRKIGPRTYTLNHIALGYDQGFGGPLFRVHIHATVKVDKSGKSFLGDFDALVCIKPPPVEDPFLEDGTCFDGGAGHITGTLVQPD